MSTASLFLHALLRLAQLAGLGAGGVVQLDGVLLVVVPGELQLLGAGLGGEKYFIAESEDGFVAFSGNDFDGPGTYADGREQGYVTCGFVRQLHAVH